MNGRAELVITVLEPPPWWLASDLIFQAVVFALGGVVLAWWLCMHGEGR